MNEAARAVEQAIRDRRSIRGFRPDAVPAETVRALLEVASHAPSGSNLQPWQVHVVRGAALQRLARTLTDAFWRGEPLQKEYEYYPTDWTAEWKERRRACGWALYELAGVARGDREGSKRQVARNYAFFGAPVGLIFTMDRRVNIGSWLDLGMFIQNFMVAATARGLATCPQVSLANYPAILADSLDIPAQHKVICGMSLGHADDSDPTSRLRTPREPVERFAVFHED